MAGATTHQRSTESASAATQPTTTASRAAPRRRGLPAFSQHRGDLVTLAVVSVISIAMVTLLFWPSRWWWDASTEVDCTSFQATPVQQTGDDGPAVVPLEVASSQDPILRFGRSRVARSLTVALAMSAPEDTESPETPRLDDGTLLMTQARSFQRSDGAAIPAEAIFTSARVVGNQVDLTVCIQPEDPADGTGDGPAEPAMMSSHGGSSDVAALQPVPPPAQTRNWTIQPGTYVGSVAIADPRVAPLTVQVGVTRSFVRWWSVVAIAVLSAMAGVVWLFLLRTTDVRPNASPFGHWSFLRWLRRRDSFISIATGLVGVSAVYTGTYLRSEDWGASSTAFLAFVGAVFTAFITAASAGALAGRGDEKPTASEEPAAPSPPVEGDGGRVGDAHRPA